MIRSAIASLFVLMASAAGAQTLPSPAYNALKSNSLSVGPIANPYPLAITADGVGNGKITTATANGAGTIEVGPNVKLDGITFANTVSATNLAATALVNGVSLATIGSDAVGAAAASINPLNTSSGLTVTAGIPCAGNSGTDGTNVAGDQFAYGSVCQFVKAPGPVLFPSGGSQYPQTYAWQVGLELPSLPSNPNVVPGAKQETDQVAFYPEVRAGAWSPGVWAENPLVALGKDAGGGIISEYDMNDFQGCDTNGVDTGSNSTGGSNSFLSTRSDGSACPGALGLLITGVGNRISGQAIAVSGVSNSAGDMWQDGIAMIGGYLINEADFIENTGARSAIKLEGVHTRGLDLSTGHYSFGAITLPLSNDGKLVWQVPQGSGSTSAVNLPVTGYATTPQYIYPYSDAKMHFSGGQWKFDATVEAGTGIISDANITATGAVSAAALFSSGESDFGKCGSGTGQFDPDPGVARDLKACSNGIATTSVKTISETATGTIGTQNLDASGTINTDLMNPHTAGVQTYHAGTGGDLYVGNEISKGKMFDQSGTGYAASSTSTVAATDSQTRVMLQGAVGATLSNAITVKLPPNPVDQQPFSVVGDVIVTNFSLAAVANSGGTTPTIAISPTSFNYNAPVHLIYVAANSVWEPR